MEPVVIMVRLVVLIILCSSFISEVNGNEIFKDQARSGSEILYQKSDTLKKPDHAPYKNSNLTPEQRAEDLLSRMTLEEKIGQINMPCAYESALGKDVPEKIEGIRKFTAGTKEKNTGPGGGFFTLPNNILFEGPRQQALFHNELQKIAVEGTRLGIPLLMTEEGTHGLMCSGATIFPEGLAIGSTWNMDLVKDIYSVAAHEARTIGIHQLFTLVVEPTRDPRLGRNEEGYSEDPFLCSKIAEAIVEGTQGNDISEPGRVVAGLCHFPGQSQPVSGIERGPMEISERKLREVFLPPWVAGIKKKGALGVMATYPAIDGVPAHASEKLMTKILRDELDFQGLVLSEGGGISTLVYEHVAESQKEAGAIALKAGVDVGISYEEGFIQGMFENVMEGKVSIKDIDRAVRRVLLQKFRLGLFENPYANPDVAFSVSHTKEHQDLALQAAREGIVLLKNENKILPLRKNIGSIAVIGPNADEPRNQLGDYTSRTIIQEITTPLAGIKELASPNTRITYVKGCNVVGTELDEIKKARSAARKSDIAIVIVGENERRAPKGTGTNGEGLDVASLDLTGLQEELIKAVVSTGTPTIVVLINGRPLSVRWVAENVPAVIEAWNCGEKGGTALAEIIFGDVNPSGRLPVTIPGSAGQLPLYYNYSHARTERMKQGYVDMSLAPLYPFGFGLNYTDFVYSDLKIVPAGPSSEGSFLVSFNLKNSGKMAGSEVAQLYINDVISSVTRPVKELKGFMKITLGPGESKNIQFRLGTEDLSFFGQNLERNVEPGRFVVMIGSSSEDIKLKDEIEVKSEISTDLFGIREPGRPYIIGHRGMMLRAPENTLAAFSACVERGIGIEIDVRSSKDDQMVIIHDDNFSRTTNGPDVPIRALTLSELKKLDAGSWYGPEFSGQKIPTLEETLQLVHNRQIAEVPIALNIKDISIDNEAKLIELLNKYDLLNQTFFFDQSEDCSARLKKTDSRVRIAQNVERSKLYQELEKKYVDVFLVWFVPSEEELYRLRSEGRGIVLNLGGTRKNGNDPQSWKEFLVSGIDAVIIDHSLEFNNYLDTLNWDLNRDH